MKLFESQLMAGIPTPQEVTKQALVNSMDLLNKHDLDALVAEYTPDARFHGWAPQTLDVNGYKQAMSELIAAFPDARFTVDDAIAEGDKVVIRHHFEGTHTGTAFHGVPVSNRKAHADGVVIFKLKDGKVAEAWLNADFLAILTQIGAIPAGK